MREDVASCGQGPDFGAGEETEGFSGESGGTAEGDFKEAGEESLGFCLSGGELSGGGMSREDDGLEERGWSGDV